MSHSSQLFEDLRMGGGITAAIGLAAIGGLCLVLFLVG